jgi:release factor glutamine methyltransferase
MASPDRRWKLIDLLQEASGFLADRELDSPRLEAELLLAAALGIRRLDLYLQFDKILTADEVEAFRAFVRQRLAGRPTQYITGEAGFRLLDLHVDDSVLVPRPETELLVEEALAFLPQAPSGPVLDLCCGSGAIAIAVAHESDAVDLVAIDLSPEALRVARRNARRHDVDGRIRFLCGDLCAPLHSLRCGAVLCNPPYIRTDELADLQPEVRDHEPRLALDGGPDGLDVIRRIAATILPHMAPAAQLFLEVGAGQADVVAQLILGSGFDGVEIRNDLAGIPRLVIATSPAPPRG